jgi:hypothetical protein
LRKIKLEKVRSNPTGRDFKPARPTSNKQSWKVKNTRITGVDNDLNFPGENKRAIFAGNISGFAENHPKATKDASAKVWLAEIVVRTKIAKRALHFRELLRILSTMASLFR